MELSSAFLPPASLGQLIICVYDVKTVGGNSNTLAFPRNTERARARVKNQVESVSNNDLIYACQSFRERTTKSELAQVNMQLSRLHRVRCVYVCLCLYMCVCVCIRVFVRTMMQTSSSSSHLLKQSDWSLHIGAALQHFASRLHRLWGLLTYSHWLQVTTLKSRKPEKKLRFPHHAGQIRTRVWQKRPEMMLVVISVWHGSVIKYPLVILYIYVLTAATVTTTGFGILGPRGRSVESEQNNSVVISWRAYDCAVISEAVVTALFSPSASPCLHTHLLASCSLPHHRLCLHTKSSLRWRYMDSRVLKWSSGFRLLAVSQFFLKSSAGSTGWFLSRSLFQ